MPHLTTDDGVKLYYEETGSGIPIVFVHEFAGDYRAWEPQVRYFSRGYRCIAHDRRGHGRSDQPWTGNDMDTYADDLAALVEALDLKGAALVGHSTGGGETTRYVRNARTLLAEIG